MEIPQNSHALPTETQIDRRFQWLPLINSAQPSEDDEGGLNLGQVVGALKRRLPVIAGVTIIVTSAAMLKALSSKPVYQGGFEILTKPVTAENQVISSVPQTLGHKEDTEEKPVDATKLKLLKSPKVLEPIVDQMKPQYPSISYEELVTVLTVAPVPSSEILAVGYQDSNPDKVKTVLKLVSEAYLNYSLEERLADVRQGIDFVDAQLPQLQQRVEKVQDRLQSFRQQYNLIDPESTSKQLAEQSISVAQQRLETGVKLNEARALYNDLDQELTQNANDPASPGLSDNTRYQSLLSQILTVESEIAKESSLFKKDTPNVQVLEDQQKNLKPLLQREGRRVQEEAAGKIRELEYRDRILKQAETLLNRQIKQLSVVSRQYGDLQQELKIATDNLNQFLAKREALRIDAGQRKTPWQILTPPGDPVPSSANVKRTTALGVILGLLLGVGVALLLEKLSSVFHTAEEVKESSKLPILGSIPFNPELVEAEASNSLRKVTSIADIRALMQEFSQKITSVQDIELGASESNNSNGVGKLLPYASSLFIEAFRSLYTNIRLLSSDARIRSLVISSSVPGEGKSTIALHLAQSAAALGQKVLLVDADLRLPKLHERLDISNAIGLSQLISLDLEVEQALQPSSIEPNLFLITAGKIPPDPTKLLSSQKMQNLMEQFKEAFDLVIYDTPPLQGLADTKLIASKTDGIVMVVGLGKTKRSMLSQALDGIKPFPVTMLGVVVNGSKDDASPLYGSYHRYYANESNASTEKSPSVVSFPSDD